MTYFVDAPNRSRAVALVREYEQRFNWRQVTLLAADRA
jgi:hypothetical protein